MEFSQLILGFSSAALYYMGQAALEGRPAPQKNLPLAKQNIDIILLLKQKTSGNLSDEEKGLIEQLLSDLELRYLEAVKS